MDERNEISMELSALSELVSRIGRQTPYGVPAGYFDQFPALVMGRIASRSATFSVPEGYFDGFAASVLSRIKTGTAANAPVSEETASAELARLSPTVSRISRETPYKLPEGYFDEQSPILTVAHDQPTFRVPANYFAGLPETILEKVAAPAAPSGKVLKGNWWKYSSVASIAACLILIFSWPSVDSKINSGSAVVETTHGLEKLSDQEILAYLDDQHDALNVSAANSTAALDPGAASLDINEGDVKSLLGEVTDNDLQQYMDEHGKGDDLATN